MGNMDINTVVRRAVRRWVLCRRKFSSVRKEISSTEQMECRLEQFVRNRWALRYNLLSGQTEFRPKEEGHAPFRPVTQRDANALCLSAHEAGIACWDRDMARFLQSSRIEAYHPFRHYLDRLPAWDGTDRLPDLARRVSAEAWWTDCFHRWMLALTAQWMGLNPRYANSVAPILVSEKQGMGKSTFCRSLLPPELSAYYTDSLDLSNVAQLERRLVEMGLLNLDEFDRIPVRRHPALKNILQLTDLHIRKAYQRDTRRLPRIASFIGTSNTRELLSDPSGSRRFLCVDVVSPIDSDGIDYTQVYAQLKAELEQGERYWFTSEDEAAIQQRNTGYYRICPADEVFSQYFRAARPDEEGRMCSLAEILSLLRKKFPGALSGIRMQDFSRALVAAGVERKHTIKGNRYRIVEIPQ